MKTIVCGGRDFKDLKYLFQVMDLCLGWWKLETIITGGAKGADSLAHEWACRRKLQTEVYHADWDTHGKAAGMIRNRLMLQQEPNVVIAFPGSSGTENMITISRKAGIPVFIPGAGK